MVDDEQRPVEGTAVRIARDAIQSAGLEATTGPAGEFAFVGLEAARYQVHAARIGYEAPPARWVVVEPDAVAEINFVLRPLAIVEPHHEVRPYSTYVAWHACVVVLTGWFCPLLLFGPDHLTEPFYANESKGALYTFLVESKWVSSVGACVQGHRTDVYSPEYSGLPLRASRSGPFYWSNLPNVTSPTRLVIDRSEERDGLASPARRAANGGEPVESAGVWHVQSYPERVPQSGLVGFQCAIDQRFHIAIAGFFESPAPAGWTAFP